LAVSLEVPTVVAETLTHSYYTVLQVHPDAEREIISGEFLSPLTSKLKEKKR